MEKRAAKLVVVFTVSFYLLACAATPKPGLLEQWLISAEAERLNAEQARSHLSGNTQEWANGGAYFHPDGKVDTRWAVYSYPGNSWSVDENGRVCIKNPEGFTTSCSVYYDNNGTIWFVTVEVFGEPVNNDGGPDVIFEGNVLEYLRPGQRINL